MQKSIPDAVTLFLSDSRGDYIPQNFIESINIERWSGITQENVDILLSGPDHELYWDAWDDVLSSAYYLDESNNTYSLHQDGDLWIYCIERMTLQEQVDLFNASYEGDFCIPDGYLLFEVNNVFVYPLYYGDTSGLMDDEEEKHLNAFIAKYGGNIVESVDADEFGECEITGLRGNTSYILLKEKDDE